MTYIQTSHHKDLLNRVIVGLALFTVLGIFWLVLLYNNIVDLNHTISTAKARLDSVGAENTTLNNQTVAALHNIQSSALASQDGLVMDNHPQYFTQSWPIASQR